MDKFDWFKEKFENVLSEEEQIEIFNDFADENGLEEKIFPMEEFNEAFSGYKPYDIFHMIWFNSDNSDWNDRFFITTSDGFKTFDSPYEFIEDYLADIYNKMHLWEQFINIDDYIEDMYDGHYDLKPEEMDSDEFYDIVENAVYSNDHESDIIEDIKKAVG